MSDLYFSQTKLSLLGKQGIMKPDGDGYYEFVIGGLNVHNNTKSWYYTAQGARELFGPGSMFQRRVANGALRAEVGHPKRQPGMTDSMYAERMMDIDLNNVCAHFKEVWLDENFGKNNPAYKDPEMIAIMAKVKPAGPKKDILIEAIQNKNENICFSIRAIADESMVRGKVIRVLKDIISIDMVNEGGIGIASKWDSPVTESIIETDAMRLTKSILEQVSRESKSGMAVESSGAIAAVLSEKYFPERKTSVISKW